MRDVRSFSELEVATPSQAALEADYRALLAAMREAQSYEQEREVFDAWQQLQGRVSTWSSLTGLRFRQDTRDQVRKQEKEFCDEVLPALQALEVELKRAFLNSPHRRAHERALGAHLFDLWEVDVVSFRPEIQDDLVALSKLDVAYTELLAGADIELDGEHYNLSELRQFRSHADRDKRERAERAQWAWFEAASTELDRIFDEMVALRHGAAVKLGYEDFTELGYKMMRRTDYTRQDVERFREQVRRFVVPLCQELRAYQAKRLDLESLKVWDLNVFDPEGNPRPKGDHDWMIARATEMFDEMGRGLGEFFSLMSERGYLDLKARKGKAGGGFCTSLQTEKSPFVFANFNGTEDDVRVFTHEMGHAFQFWSSAELPATDYHWPTYEAAEIHSMSLEFLTWPHMDKFFEAGAERFKQLHLIEGLLFLPYGVAVDHFQHMVYAEPEATPAKRRVMWKEVEAMYLPWLDWDDIAHGRNGGRWHAQSHIFHVPFYYIDYTLAQSCALQFWQRSEEDVDEALDAYASLCKLGGSMPFQQLVKQAGLVSPFEPNALEQVTAHARERLEELLA